MHFTHGAMGDIANILGDPKNVQAFCIKEHALRPMKSFEQTKRTADQNSAPMHGLQSQFPSPGDWT